MIRNRFVIILVGILLNFHANAQIQTDSLYMEEDSIIHIELPPLVIMPLPMDQPPHPYLFFNKEDLPELREKIKQPEITPIWEKIIEDAKNPNNYKFSIEKSVLPACFAYQITGDSIYTILPIRIIRNLLQQDYRWSKPAPDTPELKYMNWGIGEKTLALAYVFDMMHDKLPTTLKDSMLYALKIKVFSYYADAHRYHDTVEHKFYDPQGHYDWWTNAYFGWNSHINGAVGLAALATLWELPESPMTLKMARASLKYTHYEFNQDIEMGGYDEGVMALGEHLADLTRFYVALKRIYSTDDGFFTLPGVPLSLNFYVDFVGPDNKFVPFGMSPHRKVMDPPGELYYLANLYDNKAFTGFLDVHSHPDHNKTFALLWRNVMNDTILPGKKPEIKCYKDINWGYLNSERMFIPFKGGDNAANHNQFDAGNMLIYLNETPFLTSPGTGYDSTFYHNTLQINYKNQLSGDPQKRNLGKHSNIMAPLIQCAMVNDMPYAVIDLRKVYVNTKRYDRHILITDLGISLVLDDIELDKPGNLELFWHTPQEINNKTDSTFLLKSEWRGMYSEIESNHPFKLAITDSTPNLTVKASIEKPSEKAVFVSMFAPQAIKNPSIECAFYQNMIIVHVKVKNKTKQYVFFFENNRYEFIRDYRGEIIIEEEFIDE